MASRSLAESHRVSFRPLCFGLVAGALMPASALAAVAHFQADQVQGEGWQAQRVVVELVVDARAKPSLVLRAAAAVLPAALGSATALELHCPELRTVPGRWACPKATLRADFRDWGKQSLAVAFAFEPRTQRLDLKLEHLAIGDGQGSLQARMAGEHWEARGVLAGATLERLQSATRQWVPWPDGQWSGPVSADVQAEGDGPALRTLAADVDLPALGYSSTDGLTATDALSGALSIGWIDQPPPDAESGPSVSIRYVAKRGQLYLDPVFLDAGAAPFTLEGRGEWHAADRTLRDVAWSFRQPDVLATHGTATLNLGPGPLLRMVRAELDEVAVARAWPLYAAPYLAATDLKDLQASGELGGTLGVIDGSPSFADLSLRRFSVAAPDNTIGWEKLTGRVYWSDEESESLADAGVHASQLTWEGGRFYGLPFGASSARLQLGGRGVRLLDPLTLPVLDGGLRIETLRARHAGEPRMWLRLDAEVLPIDMTQLSQAFGWPSFGGKLAGRIPKATLADGVLTLGGNLEADVFGGRVTLGNLRLQDALGRFPQFQADVALSDLDLALVTGTFEFGYISGRLSGEVRQLQLFDWKPVAFDARLATPEDYRGARRITPRAVQNLSNLGGGSGVTSALSSGFLRFFEDFGYRRLGIACRLERDVCLMGGVAPAPGGYYLIQGSGFPRINLIGSQGRVAWSKLLRQLERLGQGAPLEVK